MIMILELCDSGTMLIVVLCAVTLGQVSLGQEPQVTISQGTMKGQVLKSRDGRDFFSFTRIPYAKPPVGERRFKIPERADNWTGVLDATRQISPCYQVPLFDFAPKIPSQEDCLYLNVFTPNITGKLPVIFSIHGGAFKIGSATGPGDVKGFMDEDVVIVAPNYRLGTMGFLSLEDNILPGNLGLKDQALALEWAYKEVSAFGGDPDLITVLGGSAGGVSSHLICEAPRTNVLIKGCVSQSGDGWASWGIAESGTAKKMALEMIKAVGCNETELLPCLQSKPIELIGNYILLQNTPIDLHLVSPVLEPETAPEAILTKWPTTANHKYSRLLGVCQDDGMIYTFQYEYQLVSQEDIKKFIDSFDQTVISGFHLENRKSDFMRIKERFFTKGVDPLLAIRNFATEYMWVYPALKSLDTHAGPTYFYKFNYTKGPSAPFHSKAHPGVPHGAEGPFFGMDKNTPSPTGWPTAQDIELSKLLVKMWVNFARNQNPSSQDTMEWTMFQGQYFLDIQDSGVTVGNLTQYHEILDFWKTIFPDQKSKSSTIRSSIFFIAALCFVSTLKGLFT